jgi:tRNA pseudouridine55 synthase
VDHERPVTGILVLDKPTGITSAAAVDKVKRALGVKRAGHGGTLDPIATGVLPICLGEATKIASYLLADDKHYDAELVLGIETDTLDRAGAIVAQKSIDGVTREALAAALAKRTGEHDQVPPMYSAIKQGGVRLYKQARAGIEVERAPRRVRIDHLALRAFAGARATIEISCSKGTYVRSLVADIGRDLGCGAYLAELRRTRSGIFTLAQAQRLDALDVTRVVHIRDVLRLPVVVVPAELVARVLSGVQLRLDGAVILTVPPEPEQFQLVNDAGTLLAIAHVTAGRIIYDRVFPP